MKVRNIKKIIWLSCLIVIALMVSYIAFTIAVPRTVNATDFPVSNVTELINAINAANDEVANPGPDTINMEVGTYTLTEVNNTNDVTGPNGLPIITSDITINGAGAVDNTIGAEHTVIVGEPPTISFSSLSESIVFRIFYVDTLGRLEITRLTITGGRPVPIAIDHPDDFGDSTGGGINNQGEVEISECNIFRNSAEVGGGIRNRGVASITNSTIAHNNASLLQAVGGAFGGGISNVGELYIQNSFIYRNTADFAAGIFNGGEAEIINSTITNNFAEDFQTSTGGIENAGMLTITNCTFNQNVNIDISNIFHLDATIDLQNTILDSCFGCNDLGNNLFGDAVLGELTIPGILDTTGVIFGGTPGKGHFPLISNIPIDAGNDGACPETDQRGHSRIDILGIGTAICDIGAIEFFPIVNGRVTLRQNELVTQFDPTPVPGGPAGTFLITAKFDNTSNQTINNPFFEVIILTGKNLLLNADGGPGGEGATMTPPGSIETPFEPGQTATFQFKIGLFTLDKFQFFVNLLGGLNS